LVSDNFRIHNRNIRVSGKIGACDFSHAMSANEFSKNNEPTIIYSCSGCSDAGELADCVARQLSKQGVGQMSCLAGIGGRVKPLMITAQKAQRIIVVDGCPLNCARHTLQNAGLHGFQHIALQDLGHRKNSCPVTDERVANATAAAAELIKNAEVAARER
jgi:uncharacterized metal-binding protein